MPPPEEAYLLQKAVLWKAIGTDDYGQVLVDDPVEIDVRWITNRREAIDPKGNTVVLDATAVVNCVIPVGSQMALGRISRWPGTDRNVDDNELMQVMTYREVPDLKNRTFRRTVGLMRFRNLPAQTG